MPKELPVELIYLLIAAALLLVNYVTRQAAKRRQSELPPEEPPRVESPDDEPLPPIWGRKPSGQAETPDDEPLPPIWGRKPSGQAETPDDEPLPPIWGRKPSIPASLPVPAATVEPTRLFDAQIASRARPERRYSRRSLMGTRRDVQNAIVIATIVGPCRAFEPHDVR